MLVRQYFYAIKKQLKAPKKPGYISSWAGGLVFHLSVYFLQGSKTEQLQKNPTAFVNPEQPLIDKLEVLDEDISAQEQKVKDARNRLAAAIKALG